MRSGRRITENPAPALAQRRRPQYTWQPGTVQPFSSLWMTVLRFALLNMPKFSSLNEDLQGVEAARCRRSINFRSFAPWPTHRSIDLAHFADMLGEPLEVFKWSTPSELPWGMRREVPLGTRCCPVCMEEGFHTVLFSVAGIHECPHHAEALIDKCPFCQHSLADRSRVWTGHYPRICACADPWLTMEVARRPTPNVERDRTLSEVAQWVEATSRRCWAYVPGAWMMSEPYSRDRTDLDALEHHILRWEQELAQPTPAWLGLPVARRRPRPSEPQLRVVERSTFKAVSLARVPGAGHARYVGRDGAFGYAGIRRPFLLFKCMRRYLVKHVLGNRVHLMVWVGKNLSGPELRRRTVAEPLVRAAWWILYWMQSTYWNERGCRNWFRRLVGITSPPKRDNDPTYHWPYPRQNHVLAGSKLAIDGWMEDWINAGALLELWPTQEDWVIQSQDDAFLWPRTSLARQPIRWWAWIGDEANVLLGMYRRAVDGPQPLVRRPKSDRVVFSDNAQQERRQRLLEAVNGQLLRQCDDGKWRVERRRTFALEADIRTCRLHVGRRHTCRVAVALDPLDTADPKAPWLIRCVDYPVGVTASTRREAMDKLRPAVRAYVKLFGKTPAAGAHAPSPDVRARGGVGA